MSVVKDEDEVDASLVIGEPASFYLVLNLLCVQIEPDNNDT